MARYIGPKCKLARREGTDLFLKSARRSLDSKCKLDTKPGQHGVKSGMRMSDYGNQLREKQKLRRIYGVLERQFRRYFARGGAPQGLDRRRTCCSSSSRASTTSSTGWASARTRAEARQLVTHGSILVNGKRLNVPSALVQGRRRRRRSPSKAKGQLRILDALQLAEKVGFPSWVEVDAKKMTGTFKGAPDRSEFGQDINESLVVELYSQVMQRRRLRAASRRAAVVLGFAEGSACRAMSC